MEICLGFLVTGFQPSETLNTAAPSIFPSRSAASASFASSSGNGFTVVSIGTRAATSMNRTPSFRVRLATLRITRSSQRSRYGNEGMTLMWIPAQTTVPPRSTDFSASTTSGPTGANRITAS